MFSESIPLPWQDMMSLENDFPSRAHCLSRWYGLRDFVTVSPAPDMSNIMSESRLNILLSSVAVAVNNTSWWVDNMITMVVQGARGGEQQCPQLF